MCETLWVGVLLRNHKLFPADGKSVILGLPPRKTPPMMHFLQSWVRALCVALTNPPACDTRRRLQAVAADPRLTTCADVELLVRAHGVPESKVWAVIDRLARGRVDPTLAWSWTVEHDGGEFADLCATPMADREVVAHMAIGPRVLRVRPHLVAS
ncbi:hypothetical protein GCM10027020_34940 [Nocardioides salsibiostraticola]